MAAKPADMESLLECCICLGECKDPRVLPCLHSLCRHCLEDHISSSAQGGRYKCPACRHECDIPAEGAGGVPKNFFMNTLKDILQRQAGELEQATVTAAAAEVEQLECSNKHLEAVIHSNVTVYCVQCSTYLCSNCEACHKVFFGGSHELQQIDGVAATGGQIGVKPRKQKPRCDQHPALHNDMYCNSCHMPMCIQCCLVKHKQHEYCELDDLAEESKVKLAELTKTAKKRYDLLEKHLRKLDGTKVKIDADAAKATREIDRAADELIDLVTKRRQALIKEMKDIHDVAATELSAAYKQTELNKASIQSLLSYIQALQAAGDVSDQVVHTPGLQEQLRQQETSPLKSVSWTVDFKRSTENVATVNALLGSVSKEHTVDRPVSVGEDKKVKLGSPLHTLTPNIKSGYYCAGITKVDDCVCVVGSSHLWIHHLKSNTGKQHTITALQAAGMTTVGNNSNTLIITDYYKKLHFITINPQNMSITKQLTKDISFQPRVVVYDHTTDRLIIDNRSEKQIVICSKTGDIEKRITVKTGIGDMWCALPTAGGAYIVLDYSKTDKVHWVNQSGDVTHTYGAGPGERLCNPWHMLQDSQGRLLVADTSNHCIRLINNQQFSHDLLTQSDGILYPSCLYLDETAGTLYVGYFTGQHKLNMYKWPFPLTSPADADTESKHFKLCVNLGRYQ